MRKFLTIDQFKAAAKAGEVQSDAAVRSGFVAEVKAEPDSSRVLTFTISTETVDRQNDIVSIDGWDLDNYLKNPVVLWAHDYSMPPIARALKLWKHSGKLKASAEFAPAENPAVGQLAEGVLQLYKGGFLAAVSVGFLPRKWAWSDDENRKYGIDFAEQELLEFSAVPVPANPEALLGAKAAGHDTSAVSRWAEAVLRDSGEFAELRARADRLDADLRAEKDLSARRAAIALLRKRL